MKRTGLTSLERTATFGAMRLVIGMALTGTAAACVNVAAPDKPIVINLNINVTQEVVYRLDGEAKSLIKQNPGIF
jgi:YnbE-like lipoprotein